MRLPICWSSPSSVLMLVYLYVMILCLLGAGDNFSVTRKGLPVGGLRSEAQAKKK
jgi:hypothetical protein